MPLKIQADGTNVDPQPNTINFAGFASSVANGVVTLTPGGAESFSTLTATTKVLTPIVDAVSAGALAIGTTTATSIALNQNVTVAAGKSITPNATGGIAPSVAGYKTFWTAGVGVTLATSGTDTACSNGDIYWAPVFIPCNTTLTGIAYLIGSVGGTTKAIVALYSSAGALLANSATAGTTVGTAANFQALDFTATYAAVGPALYYVALQFDGTNAKFRTHPGPGQKFVVGTVAGTFGTLAAITPGTTFTASIGPIANTY